MYTVRPTQYDIDKNSALAKVFPDEQEYYEHIVNEKKKVLNDKGFQRKFSLSRVKEIAEFLDDDPYPFFPNSIIATCDLAYSDPIEDTEFLYKDVEKKAEGSSIDHMAYILDEDNKRYALIPYKPNTILVIDGQHRIEGLKRTEVLYKSSYDLFLTLIVGYDRSVVAKQFYTINYEQKSVNKSLLYHLMGEFSTDIDEISFLHNTVKILNELSVSPFYKRVKMLGSVPDDATPEERKLLSVSQAALIDHLIPTISGSAMNSLYPPIFWYYYYKDDYRSQIINVISRFFRAVRDLQPDWDRPESNLISKSMGIGALVKVLQFLWVKLLADKYDNSFINILDIEKDDFKKVLSGLENVDFSREGPFGRVGSAGSMNKIKEEIIEKVEYFKADNYLNFVTLFKDEYKKQYVSRLLSQK